MIVKMSDLVKVISEEISTVMGGEVRTSFSISEIRTIVSEELHTLVEKKGAIKSREYKGKKYKASKGMVAADTWKEKVDQASSWADDPEAAAAAATIVKTGKPASKKKK